MTGGMVTLMSLYNTALHTWFNFTLFDWLSGMFLRWPIAFVASLTIGDVVAKRVLMPLVRKKVSGVWREVLMLRDCPCARQRGDRALADESRSKR